jgi:hypothetical protein
VGRVWLSLLVRVWVVASPPFFVARAAGVLQVDGVQTRVMHEPARTEKQCLQMDRLARHSLPRAGFGWKAREGVPQHCSRHGRREGGQPDVAGIGSFVPPLRVLYLVLDECYVRAALAARKRKDILQVPTISHRQAVYLQSELHALGRKC